MEKPSVTLTYPAASALGLLSGGFTVFFVFMMTVSQEPVEDEVFLWGSVLLFVLVSVFSFLMAASSQTLDEHGLRIKTPLFTKQFAWADVKRVELREQYGRRGSRHPELTMDLSGWLPGWPMDYTKRVMSCIRYYYGEPDFDNWGEPPVLF